MEDDDLLRASEETIRSLLAEVPFVRIESVERSRAPGAGSLQIDVSFRLSASDKEWQVLVECRREAQPRQVRDAAYRLASFFSGSANKYGVLVAPYVSPESAQICADVGIGFADHAGNCRLSFDHVFIERRSAGNPFRAKRELRSMFSSRASRILRQMLTPPLHSWRVQELAEAADVSMGHVSNVRKQLLDRELAVIDDDGMRIAKPKELLESWGKIYEPRPRSRKQFYSILHGESLETAMRNALALAGDGRDAVLASFSAARWLAPFVRQSKTFYYATPHGREILEDVLKLQSIEEGENIVIDQPREDDAFSMRLEPVPGIWTTGIIQTWLDISSAGERGAEAADHLLREKLLPEWSLPHA